MRLKLIYIFLGFIFIACEDEIDPTVLNSGTSFFPLTLGQERVYQVQETNYLISGEVEEQTYQLREEIVDSYLSASDSIYITYRYRRSDSTEDWNYIETWRAKRNNFQGIVIEGNTPLLKITFPIVAGKSWDGNRLNVKDEDLYLMDSIYFPFTTDDQQFDSTLTVIQNDNQDFIVEQDRRYEIYADKIGLVYKNENVIQYCTDDNCLGQQVIETGREFEQRLIQYEE